MSKGLRIENPVPLGNRVDLFDKIDYGVFVTAGVAVDIAVGMGVAMLTGTCSSQPGRMFVAAPSVSTSGFAATMASTVLLHLAAITPRLSPGKTKYVIFVPGTMPVGQGVAVGTGMPGGGSWIV